MRYLNPLKQILCVVLSASMIINPLAAYADDTVDVDDFISQLGKEGQQFGTQLNNQIKTTPARVQDGQITVPGLDSNGQMNYQSGQQFNVNKLYPGSNPDNDASDYFPDGVSPDVSSLNDVYNSEGGMLQAGSNAKSSLWSDAQREEPLTVEGAAYKVLNDTSDLSKPDLRNDPMLTQGQYSTGKTFENIDVISEGFGDCTKSDLFSDTTQDYHNPEYETCERVEKPKGLCTIRNTIELYSKNTSVYIAGKGREVITVEFNLRTGSWRTISPTDSLFAVAEIPVLNYQEICPSGKGTATKFVAGYDWTGWMAMGMEGIQDSTVEYKDLQLPSCDNGLVGRVQIRDRESGDSLKFVLGGRFDFDFRILNQNSWSPESCIKEANMIHDGFCEGEIEITHGAKNDAECIVVNGIQICPGDPLHDAMADSPVIDVPKLAEVVEVSEITCDYNIGDMQCYIDANGVEQCHHNDGGFDRCEALENDPNCGFISSECVDGAEGESGACYVKEEVWDCGTTVTVDTIDKETEYNCSGEIRCMGDDCIVPTETENQVDNFAQAAALLNAAQFMTQDMSCSGGASSDGGDSNIDEGCTAFGGKPGECKVAVGGVQSCCEKPSNVGMAEYMAMIMAVPKIDAAIMAMESGSAIQSGYTAIREPVMNFVDNISGAVEQVKDQVVEELQEYSKELIQDLFPDLAQDTTTDAAQQAAADAAAEQAQEEIRNQALATATSALSTMSTIYTAYVVTVAIIQLLYACEEEEITLNVQRKMNNCTRVGSYCKDSKLGMCIEKRTAYCCFNSPLSRIIQEQIRLQTGQSFGRPRNPQCQGIPIDELAQLDWGQIDLSEWIALLQENGMLADLENMTIDSLTGSGSDFNYNDERKPADERAHALLDGVNVNEKRDETADLIDRDFSQ